jgi:hypothetical protein
MNEGELKIQFKKATDYQEALTIGYKTIALGYPGVAFEMAQTLLQELANDPEPEKFRPSQFGQTRHKNWFLRRYYHKPGKKTNDINEFYFIAKESVEK